MRRHTLRGANGKFQKRYHEPVGLGLRDGWTLLVAALVATSLAMLLARCHMVWSGGDIHMPIELPRDLLSPLE